MKCFIVLALFYQICDSTSEFISVTRNPSRSPCENLNKNVLIEHFFNTIFTEFYTTPPVCVCVQMCAGQSTYCYPNGCLRSAVHEEHDLKTPTTQYPVIQKNKNHFILLKGERDFMTEFLEQNYVNDLKEPTQPHGPVEDLRPDVFKKKYSVVGKYNTAANLNLRSTSVIHDKVKKDVMKTEGVDWTKTRWPLNTQNWRNGRRAFIEKPMRSQGTYFATMLHDNDVADYSTKYFKRELAKTVDDDEGNVQAFYHLENELNSTDGKGFSLETLIDNLIRSSFGTNIETTTHIPITSRDEAKMPNDKMLSTNSTALTNETTSVISMNFTNENVDRNKYLETSQIKNSTSLNDMISVLSSRIEIENNTSMEMARRTIKDFDEGALKINEDEQHKYNSTLETTEIDLTPKVTAIEKLPNYQHTTDSIATTIESEPESTTSHEFRVTKKNRQKVVKKASSKMNNPDINPKF